MPIRRSSDSFSWASPTTPHSKPLRQVIAAHPNLNAATEAWESHSYADALASEGAIVAGHNTAVDARKDAPYQSFLNGAAPPGGVAAVGHALVSPFAVAAKGGEAEMSASRLATTTTVDTPGSALTIGTSPYATSVGGTSRLGDSGSLGGLASAGKKSKTLALNGGFDNVVGGGLGITLVSEDKITILGEAITGEDGVTRRLARFKSKVMPVVDLGLNSVTDHFGAGVRLVGVVGREYIYEKFVDVNILAALMRKRDHWFRPFVETAAAIGLAGGVERLSRTELAANPGRIDSMLPGESATWRSSRGVLLGVSAGMYGARVNGQYHVQGEFAYRLRRKAEGIVELSVQPYKIEGARFSAEVRVLVDAGAHFLTAASQLRAWSFDLAVPEARVALSKGLQGELPGQLPPSGLHSFGATAAMVAQVSGEDLPPGVCHLETTFTYARSTILSLSSIQLPEPLGGHSLGMEIETLKTSVGTVQPEAVKFSQTVERSRHQNLLTLGNLSQRDSAALITALSIGPNGQTRTEPLEIVTLVSRETTGSHKFGRHRVLVGLGKNERLDDLARSTSVQSTLRYAAQIQRSTSLGNLEQAAQTSTARLQEISRQRKIPVSELADVRQAAAAAVRIGTPRSFAHVLKVATRKGGKSIEAFHALAGAQDFSLSVSNESHDRILLDFFKAETYLLGARKIRHARKVAGRLEKLLTRIDKAAGELDGDTLAQQLPDSMARKSREFLQILRAETAFMLANLKAELEG